MHVNDIEDVGLAVWADVFSNTVVDNEATMLNKQGQPVLPREAWHQGEGNNAISASFKDNDTGRIYSIAITRAQPPKTEEQQADEEAKLTAAGPGELDREQHPVPTEGEHGERFD